MDPCPYPFKLLHLFTTHGRTFTFRNGLVNVDNETVIAFEYIAASDGQTKHGVFYKSNLVGVSTLQ